MGYSCTQKASFVLEALEEFMKEKGETSSNTFVAEDTGRGFFEIGREQHDHAITGTVWRFIHGSENIRKAGSFRISPEGKFERFPGLSVKTRKLIEERASSRKVVPVFQYCY